jgi:hypothetical protein
LFKVVFISQIDKKAQSERILFRISHPRLVARRKALKYVGRFKQKEYGFQLEAVLKICVIL